MKRIVRPGLTQDIVELTSQHLMLVLTALAVAIAYYVGAKVAFWVGTLSYFFAPLWPPNMILFCALLQAPYRHWGIYIAAALPDWSLAMVVHALQALRGMALVAAATLVAELGDITRFANPRQLMAYLGLVPSEHSSGGTRRQGGITKAGNGAARRMLIEAAWSYRFPARISREQLLRQEGLAEPIRDTARKAQERLFRRYRKLARAGKPPTVVTAAIARELAGFVWAIAKQSTC